MCVCRLGTLEQVGVMYFTIDNRVECGNAGKHKDVVKVCESMNMLSYFFIYLFRHYKFIRL